MAAIEPNTDFYLIKSPLEPDQQNQLKFSSSTAQVNYFSNLPHKFFQHFTFQRHDSTVTIPLNATFTYEDARLYNYCMYRNNAYGNKWIFAFITGCEWSSNGSCKLSIKTDVWQTWCFALTFKRCLVEREHVNNDAIGANTLNEDLGTGELIINGYDSVYNASPAASGGDWYIVLQVTELFVVEGNDEDSLKAMTQRRVYNGIVQGCYTVVLAYNNVGILSLGTILGWYDSYGKADAVVSMFAIPASVVPDATTGWFASQMRYKDDPILEDPKHVAIFGVPAATFGTVSLQDVTVSRNSTIDGYSPANNKLFTWPFNYMLVNNNNGVIKDYRYEDFANPSSVTFNGRAALTNGGSIRLFPKNYKRQNDSTAMWSFGLAGQVYPTLSWQSDYYLNWLAQNQNAMNTERTFSVIGAVTGSAASIASGVAQAAGGNVAGGVISAVSGVANNVVSAVHTAKSLADQEHQAEIVPAQMRGSSSGDLNLTHGNTGFVVYKMSIRAEVARMIDSYFSMYGYKVSALKTPNLTGRRNWNYVKTAQCNIIGDIPTADVEELKTIFNNGITLWHNTVTFMDYSQSNPIV